MDPLTHTLVGASLAATRLGEKTRLATPALLIGANLPDVDALSYFRGGDFALGFRRGWTHGVLALVVLPALLAGLLLLWDRWRGRRDSELTISPGWLLGLCYLACLTHPLLDWLNNYGMRWWMPFRDTWYYGDSFFIVDPWLWLILGVGWLLGRKPTRAFAVTATVMAALLLRLVALRAPDYLPVVATVFVILLVALFWRPKASWSSPHRIATVGLLIGGFYIGSLLTLHSFTVSRVRVELDRHGLTSVEELMVGPTPANPFVWSVVASQGSVYHYGQFSWASENPLRLAETELPAARSSPLWPQIASSGHSKGFLRWVRFPWLDIEEANSNSLIHLMDARYTRGRATGFGATTIVLGTE